MRWKGISREREHEESGAGLGYPSPLLKRTPELPGGTREIPDAMRHDEVERRRCKRQTVHRRQHDARPIQQLPGGETGAGSHNHWQRQIHTVDVPSRSGERHGVAAGAASDVEQTRSIAPFGGGRL